MLDLFNEIDRRGCRFVDLNVVDLSGRWRHVTLHRESFTEKTLEHGVGFDASNLGYATLHKSDMVIIPDPDTLFFERIGEEQVASFICDVYDADTLQPNAHDPRSILKNALKSISDIADEVFLSPEYEFHVFDEVRYSVQVNQIMLEVNSPEGFWNAPFEGEYFVGRKRGYHRIYPFDRFMELRNNIVEKLENIGISVRYHHHEVGSTQLEIEVNPTTALRAADGILLVKHVVRNVAEKQGFLVTFMPKPLNDEAGNGMHVHQYLTKNAENIFAGESRGDVSEKCLSYVSGLLYHCPALMAFTNPSTNSYRRLVPGFEAPTHPTFGFADRGAAVRIPGYIKEKKNTRIEFRTIDASCNPYLGIAAMILAGIDGIRRQMELDKIHGGALPSSLYEAAESLEKDNDFLKEVFPGSLIEYWIKMKKKEHQMVMAIPHPIEYQLYFDV